MLRRKLIFNLGPPVIMLVLTAIVAVWLLEGYLHRLDHFTEHVNGATRVEDLSAEAHQLETMSGGAGSATALEWLTAFKNASQTSFVARLCR